MSITKISSARRRLELERPVRLLVQIRRGGRETAEDDFAKMCIAAELFNNRPDGNARGEFRGKGVNACGDCGKRDRARIMIFGELSELAYALANDDPRRRRRLPRSDRRS